jgi:hypothetical protein
MLILAEDVCPNISGLTVHLSSRIYQKITRVPYQLHTLPPEESNPGFVQFADERQQTTSIHSVASRKEPLIVVMLVGSSRDSRKYGV